MRPGRLWRRLLPLISLLPLLLVASCAGLERGVELYRLGKESRQLSLILMDMAAAAPSQEEQADFRAQAQAKVRESVRDLERALAIARREGDPAALDPVLVGCELGTSYFLVGENESAVGLLRILTEDYPNRPEPWMVLGVNAFNRRELVGAERAFKEALIRYQQRPADQQAPTVHRYLALTLFLVGRQEEALRHLEAYRRLDPANFDVSLEELEAHIRQLLEEAAAEDDF